MDTLDEELLRFWRILNAHKVRYIMVGGLATRFHGYNRTTDDLDLWLDDTLSNINHLIANKKAVNRPKDQMDVTMLEKIRDMKTETPGTES
jgi:hypothetical protein